MAGPGPPATVPIRSGWRTCVSHVSDQGSPGLPAGRGCPWRTPRRRIQARGLAGNTRQFESDMVLAPLDGGTRFSYRVAMVPDFWLPSLLGPSLLQHELAEQFNAMAAEMEKRHSVR